MKTLLARVLVLCLVVTAVPALGGEIVAPDTATTGETYTAWIFNELASDCWSVTSASSSEDLFLMVLEVTVSYDNPTGGLCPGLVAPWEAYEDYVFNYPGLWTIRVIEHRDHPGIPDYPDLVWEKEVTVTGPVAVETVSFGAVKAIYR